MRPWPSSLLWAAALAGPALAADTAGVEIISPGPDSVSVTVYRDLFAMITETRTIDLPAGPVTLSFDGVVETLLPASAVVGDTGRTLEQRNYDYEALAPANLLRRSVGKAVMLTRTLPGSGRVTQTAATIVAPNPDGVTLRTADGHEALSCSGLPEGLTFAEVPGDLHPTPRLSVRLAAGAAGRRVIKLSYLAQGFAWKSDYVAHLAADGRTLELTGWVTLRNLTQASFRNAEVQVVAGRLNLLYDGDGGSSTIGNTADFESEAELQDARDQRLGEMTEEQSEDASSADLAFLSGCYPLGAARASARPQRSEREQKFGEGYGVGSFGGEMDEIVVTGMRRTISSPERLADYHLYRIPWPTDLNARQTKQVVFLQKDRVKAERLYSLRLDPEGIDEDEARRPEVRVSFENRKSNGLGEPLPGGMYRVFEAGDAGPVFAGESMVGDKAVGVPVEFGIANALGLSVDVSFEEDDDSDYDEGDVIVRARNAKPWPVLLEVRQSPGDSGMRLKVSRWNLRAVRRHGDPTWRLNVPANSVEELRYRLRVEEPDEDTR